jgi:hypothetical protein
MRISAGRLAALVCVGVFTMAAGCKQQGPLERAGEEIDEAVDTAKNGKESTATKIDDAADELRDGVKDASKELKK